MSNEREFRWDDVIENEGGDWTLLQPGEVNFRVLKFERKRFGGSVKLPPCPQAALEIELSNDAGESTTVTHNLFLHSKTEGLLCQFFTAIGARSHGERLVMDWSKVVGSCGRCKVKIRDWTAKDGTTKQSNEIDKFLDPPATVATTNPPATDGDYVPF